MICMASYSCHRHLSTISNTLVLSIKPIVPFFSLSTLKISKKRCIMYMRQMNFVHLPHAEHSKKGYFARRQEKRVRKALIRTTLFLAIQSPVSASLYHKTDSSLTEFPPRLTTLTSLKFQQAILGMHRHRRC